MNSRYLTAVLIASLGLTLYAPVAKHAAAAPPAPQVTLRSQGDHVSLETSEQLWARGSKPGPASRDVRRSPLGPIKVAADPDSSSGASTPKAVELFRQSGTERLQGVGRINVNNQTEDGRLVGIQSYVTDKSLSIAWSAPERPVRWNVYMDGKLLRQTNDPQYTIQSPLVAPAHIQVEGEFIPSSEEVERRKANGEPPLVTTFNYSSTVLPYRSQQVRYVPTSESSGNLPEAAEPRAALSYDATFSWHAFIPFDRVPQPPGICIKTVPNSAYDSGNHRYFMASTGDDAFQSSKLATQTTMSVTPTRVSWDFRRFVGHTDVFDSNGNFMRRLQADIAGTLAIPGGTPTQGDTTMILADPDFPRAGNPACRLTEELGAIVLETRYRASPSGSISWNVKHTKAPSHELVIRARGGVAPVYQFASRSFSALTYGAVVQTVGDGTVDSLDLSTHVFGSTITDRWNSVEGIVGSPTTEERCGLRDDGCYQGFTRGLLYSSPAGTYWIRGAILQKWGDSGFEKSAFGYPVSDEICALRDGGCVQRFQNGLIYWSPSTGVHSVRGAILSTYAEQKWETGYLGYPTGDEFCGLRDAGCAQHFQGGSIYISAGTPAHGVRGAIRDKWAEKGWETSPLGYPTSEEFCGLRNGGCGQHFQGGSIYFSPGTGAHSIWGAIRDEWASKGWENSGYGYPVTDEYTVVGYPTHKAQDFANGWIEFSPESGVNGGWKRGQVETLRPMNEPEWGTYAQQVKRLRG